MAMVIGTNVASLTAQRHLEASRQSMETSMERLASGNRINSAMDDAAGLAIVHRMDAQVTGMNQAVRNANDGIAMLQTAEGAMDEISTILTRMKELTVQGMNDTYTATDRDALDAEFQQLTAEITRISENTKFNDILVIGGTATVKFQVGDKGGDTISQVFQNMNSTSLGVQGTASTAAAVINETAAQGHTVGVAGSTKQAVKLTFTNANVATGDSISVAIGGKTYTQNFVASGDTTTTTDMAATLNALGGQIVGDSSTSGFNTLLTDATIAGATTTLATVTSLTLTATAQSATQIDIGSAQIFDATSTATSTSVDLQDLTNATAALTVVDAAIVTVDTYRTELGAKQNRLDHTVSNLMNRSENTSAARSRINDADFASESANLAKAQVLQQAGTAMLAQANASTQNVLSLLK